MCSFADVGIRLRKMFRWQTSDHSIEDFSRENGNKFANINCINWKQGKHFINYTFLLVYELANCILYQSWKFDNIRLKPNGADIMLEVLVVCLFGPFAKLLFSPRALISPVNWG